MQGPSWWNERISAVQPPICEKIFFAGEKHQNNPQDLKCLNPSETQTLADAITFFAGEQFNIPIFSRWNDEFW